MTQFFPNTLYLCSKSQRRIDILQSLHIATSPCEISIDESPLKKELPKDLVLRLAKNKMIECLKTYPHLKDHTVLTADTVVGVGRRILGKPMDKQAAYAQLTLLSGRRHTVYGGLCFYRNHRMHLRLVKTFVIMKRLPKFEIERYLSMASQWKDACGSYAIQGMAGLFVRKILGSYTNVMGLDAYTIGQLCEGTGFFHHNND